MQVDFNNNLELEGDSDGAVEASISKENLPLIMDILIRQQYRNPIGSIVREITSNCFDAHAEIGVDDAVMIKFSIDSMGSFIQFIDVGVGMSPERIKNVFLSFGESTKRVTNNLIGGFGLGGKSPLAYTDQFFLTTVYDKIQYEYIVHRGKVLPTIELLYSDAVERRNGTEVKIYFKEYKDEFSFVTECKKQLVYFDNVFFVNNYPCKNDYQIYEGETFKVRSDVNTNPYSQYMHLCIGKVAYPIDFDILGRKALSIPVALKFEIGDLIVTPERESLRYVLVKGKETKDIINEKIDACIKELTEKYYKQPSNICNTIREYLERREEHALLKIKEVTLDLHQIIQHNNVKCRSLEGYLGLKFLKDDVYEAFSFNGTILRESKRSTKNVKRFMYPKFYEVEKWYITEATKLIPIKGEYVCERIARYYEIFVGKIKFEGWIHLFKLSRLRNVKLPDTTNVIKQLQILKLALEAEFSHHVRLYDEITVPKEWLIRTGYKEKVVRKEEEIVIYDMTIHTKSGRRRFVKPSDLSKFTGFIIYGFDENEELLLNFVELFRFSRYDTNGNGNLSISKAVKIIKIAVSNIKHFRKIKQSVHVENFIGDNKVFRNFATALIIRKESNYKQIKTNIVGNTNFEGIFGYISSEQESNSVEITKYLKEFSSIGNKVNSEFIDSIVDVALQYNLVNTKIYDKHISLNKYLDRMELLRYVHVFVPSMLVYLIDFFLLKGKQVNAIWVEPMQYEIELIHDNILRLNYILECGEMEEEYYETCSFERHKIQEELTINKSILNYYNYAKGN